MGRMIRGLFRKVLDIVALARAYLLSILHPESRHGLVRVWPLGLATAISGIFGAEIPGVANSGRQGSGYRAYLRGDWVSGQRS